MIKEVLGIAGILQIRGTMDDGATNYVFLLYSVNKE